MSLNDEYDQKLRVAPVAVAPQAVKILDVSFRQLCKEIDIAAMNPGPEERDLATILVDAMEAMLPRANEILQAAGRDPIQRIRMRDRD